MANDDLERDERAERVRDLSQRIGLDIDEGGYSFDEALQALAIAIAVLCHALSNPYVAWMAAVAESAEAMKRLDLNKN